MRCIRERTGGGGRAATDVGEAPGGAGIGATSGIGSETSGVVPVQKTGPGGEAFQTRRHGREAVRGAAVEVRANVEDTTGTPRRESTPQSTENAFPTLSHNFGNHAPRGAAGRSAPSSTANRTVRKTCAIVRSGSCDFNQNHARWNRLCTLRGLRVRFWLCGLRALCVSFFCLGLRVARNDSHRVRLRLRRREQVFQRVGGVVQMETFAVP